LKVLGIADTSADWQVEDEYSQAEVRRQQEEAKKMRLQACQINQYSIRQSINVFIDNSISCN
jgi:hypothetical protein